MLFLNMTHFFVNLLVGHGVRIDLPDDGHALGRVRLLAARLGNVEPVLHETGNGSRRRLGDADLAHLRDRLRIWRTFSLP